MRKVVIVLLIGLCCMGMCSVTSAAKSRARNSENHSKRNIEEQMEEVLEDKAQSEKADLKKVKRELQKFLKSAQRSKDKTETVSGEKSSLGYEQYEYDRAYRVQSMEWFMVTEYYKKKKNFEKLIFDEYEWCVPYVATNGQTGVATLIEDGDSFKWISETDNETREVILPDEEEIVSIAKKNLGEENTVEEIKYLGNGLYHLNMVYIKCDKGEYIIPYAENLEMLNAEAKETKLSNGKLYTVDEFMETMNTLFDEKSRMNMGDDEVGGGLPYRQPHTMRVVTVTGFLIVVLAIIGVRKYRKRNVDRDKALV